ncbi:hypothetical protein LCGC14_2624820, partial [marine sediment metagenome]
GKVPRDKISIDDWLYYPVYEFETDVPWLDKVISNVTQQTDSLGFTQIAIGAGHTTGLAAVLNIDSLLDLRQGKELVAEGELPWGFLPVVHIQNMAQPFYYEGISDVEVLMPLQDELNTRLSDRASRITFQSFKMYLGKGIEGFEDRPISPGRMWYTDNPDATIEEFGGDTAMPTRMAHRANNPKRDLRQHRHGRAKLRGALLRAAPTSHSAP